MVTVQRNHAHGDGSGFRVSFVEDMGERRTWRAHYDAANLSEAVACVVHYYGGGHYDTNLANAVKGCPVCRATVANRVKQNANR
jgi:hypothetical protein